MFGSREGLRSIYFGYLPKYLVSRPSTCTNTDRELWQATKGNENGPINEQGVEVSGQDLEVRQAENLITCLSNILGERSTSCQGAVAPNIRLKQHGVSDSV